VPRDVFVHLLEPARWRAALAEGAVRPPSLDSVGFLHLSRPDQVHLPAGYLFPGRRDLVLLVVDPARLTDPVRWEPGDPEDPSSMRFPHLYGPLPVTAVVAVVPYRPPVPPAIRTTSSPVRWPSTPPSRFDARSASATSPVGWRSSTRTFRTPGTTTSWC